MTAIGYMLWALKLYRIRSERTYEFQLVPIGAKRRRSSTLHEVTTSDDSFSSFLMGVYDSDSQRWQSVCWINYGFTTEQRKSLSIELSSSCARVNVGEDYDVVDEDECDFWFDPKQVWTVYAAGLYATSKFTCAAGKTGDSQMGVALRHPRFSVTMETNIASKEEAIRLSSTTDDFVNALSEYEIMDSDEEEILSNVAESGPQTDTDGMPPPVQVEPSQSPQSY